jgi:hypothetical protein
MCPVQRGNFSNSRAQFNLSLIYGRGEGVLHGYLQARMWVNLAAMSGDCDYKAYRGLLAELMTSQQIAKAQEMAKKCLASKYKNCD